MNISCTFTTMSLDIILYPTKVVHTWNDILTGNLKINPVILILSTHYAYM